MRLAARRRGGILKPIKQVYNPTETAPISESRSGLVTVFGTWPKTVTSQHASARLLRVARAGEPRRRSPPTAGGAEAADSPPPPVLGHPCYLPEVACQALPGCHRCRRVSGLLLDEQIQTLLGSAELARRRQCGGRIVPHTDSDFPEVASQD